MPDFAAARERMVERHIFGRGLADKLLPGREPGAVRFVPLVAGEARS